MDLQNIALAFAGAIGSGVAVIHGILTQRYMIRPLVRMARGNGMPASITRFVPVLMHFSTFVWFFGGLALIAAAGLGSGARLPTVILVGGSYLFGAIGNCWATRGRHPGWMLLGLAMVLIAFGST